MWEAWPSVSLKEVTDEKEHSKYFLFLNRHDKSEDFLKISLLSGSESYKAELSREDIEGLSGESRIPFHDFLKLTISALTSEILAEDQFAYSVSRTKGALQLTWKKVVQEDSVKIKLASLNFKEVGNANEVCNTLQQLSKYAVEKGQQLKAFREEKLELREENQRLCRELEKKVVMKEKLESEMYTKFVLVLNKKKQKCRQYKEEISKQRVHQPRRTETKSDLDDAVEPAVASKAKDTSLLFEDSSDDSMPTQTQRIVKNIRKRNAIPRKVQTRPKSRNQSNPSTASSNLLADTQELMDDL